MKKPNIILILLAILIWGLFFSLTAKAQVLRHQQIRFTPFVEVKDTVEIAYKYRYSDYWVQDGFNMSRELLKDSIGIDSIRLFRTYIRFAYKKGNDTVFEKKLIDERSEYISEPKDQYFDFLFKNQ